MENYLGCKLDITWTRTPATDYTANKLVVLQSGPVPDIGTTSKDQLSTSTAMTVPY